MIRTAVLLLAHVSLVALAASDFTLVAWLWQGDFNFRFNYFSISSRSGWGTPYVSDYSLAQVVAYVLAYGVGLLAYTQLSRYRQRLIVGAGLLFCGLGLASFALEWSHWGIDHHRSLIANFPVLAIAVGLLGLVQLGRGLLGHQRLALPPRLDTTHTVS